MEVGFSAELPTLRATGLANLQQATGEEDGSTRATKLTGELPNAGT